MSARDWLERLRGNGRSAVVQLEPADCRELAAVLAELLDFREGVEAAAEAALDATFDLGAELQRLQARAVELTTLRAELEVMKASLKELRVSGAELQRLKDQVLELERERGEVNEALAKELDRTARVERERDEARAKLSKHVSTDAVAAMESESVQRALKEAEYHRNERDRARGNEQAALLQATEAQLRAEKAERERDEARADRDVYRRVLEAIGAFLKTGAADPFAEQKSTVFLAVRELRDERDAALAQLATEREANKSLRSELKLSMDGERGLMDAVLGTIGGQVEGAPTLPINYLQRLRELTLKEALLAISKTQLATEREAHEKALAESEARYVAQTDALLKVEREAHARTLAQVAVLREAMRPIIDALNGHHTEECDDGNSDNCVACDGEDADAVSDRLLQAAHAALASTPTRAALTGAPLVVATGAAVDARDLHSGDVVYVAPVPGCVCEPVTTVKP